MLLPVLIIIALKVTEEGQRRALFFICQMPVCLSVCLSVFFLSFFESKNLKTWTPKKNQERRKRKKNKGRMEEEEHKQQNNKRNKKKRHRKKGSSSSSSLLFVLKKQTEEDVVEEKLWSNGDDDDDHHHHGRRTRREDKTTRRDGVLHSLRIEQVSLLFRVLVPLARVHSSRRDVFEREQRKFKGVFLDVLSDALMADIQFRREWERMVTERV
tara:strand:+ start:10217 stop:10855 length:639 start_codon:yes stop_codon:yes gene_type:complete